jgi:hypothetical protein
MQPFSVPERMAVSFLKNFSMLGVKLMGNVAFGLPVSEITKLGNNAAVVKGGQMILNTE